MKWPSFVLVVVILCCLFTPLGVVVVLLSTPSAAGVATKASPGGSSFTFSTDTNFLVGDHNYIFQYATGGEFWGTVIIEHHTPDGGWWAQRVGIYGDRVTIELADGGVLRMMGNQDEGS